jgi:tripartite-type tricarboxylate transporter receptor subunit TctC
MASELFKLISGITLVHVPYRGSGPMLNDFIAGQVQLAFDGIASSIGHIRAGRLRALGVATRRASRRCRTSRRSPNSCQGLGAPRNTPAEIIDLLNREINAGLADPRIRAGLTDLGNAPLPLSPAEYAKLLADETEKWGKVIRSANIKAE